MILTAWLCDYIWTGCAISQRKREILKYAILNICHGGSTNLIEIEIRIKWKKEGVHYSNFNIPAIKSQQCLYIVYLQRNTLSIRSEGDELTCGNLQYSILVMFLAFSAKVVLVTLLAHLIFNTQQKVASMHPSTVHCATFSIKKVPKKYWLVHTIFQKKSQKFFYPKTGCSI